MGVLCVVGAFAAQPLKKVGDGLLKSSGDARLLRKRNLLIRGKKFKKTAYGGLFFLGVAARLGLARLGSVRHWQGLYSGLLLKRVVIR